MIRCSNRSLLALTDQNQPHNVVGVTGFVAVGSVVKRFAAVGSVVPDLWLIVFGLYVHVGVESFDKRGLLV